MSLLEEVGYDVGYFFAYSERGKTKAARTLPDDVPEVRPRTSIEALRMEHRLPTALFGRARRRLFACEREQVKDALLDDCLGKALTMH